MTWLSPVLLTLQVISSLSIIVLVLLQQGKGADMGAAFGSGSAGSVFGSAGAANFLSRMTKWAAVLFFVTTGGLAWVAHHPSGAPIDIGVMQGFTSSTPAPVAPTGSAVPDIGAAVPAAAGDAVPAAPSAPATTSEPAAAAPATDSGAAAAAGDLSVPSVPAAPTAPAQ